MKRNLFSIALIALCIGTLTQLYATDPPPPAATAADDEKAIRAAVDKYFRGVTTADRKLLEEAWDVKNAHMKYVDVMSKGDPELKVVPIANALNWWTQVKSRTQSGKVLSLDIVDGQMAFVKFDFHYDEMHYIDYLTLYKLPSGWKIVNKTYVRLIEETGGEKSGAAPADSKTPAAPPSAGKPAEPVKPADKKD